MAISRMDLISRTLSSSREILISRLREDSRTRSSRGILISRLRGHSRTRSSRGILISRLRECSRIRSSSREILISPTAYIRRIHVTVHSLITAMAAAI